MNSFANYELGTDSQLSVGRESGHSRPPRLIIVDDSGQIILR